MVVNVGINEPFCDRTACVCAGGHAPRSYAWMADAAAAAGIDLRLTYLVFEDDFGAALAAGELDGAIAKCWPLVTGFRIAHVGYERLCDLGLPDGSPDLTGVFITTADGPIRSMRDLSGRRLASGRPESYETFHAVQPALQAIGVVPGALRQYDRCVHAAVSVLEGETDAAVVSNYCVRFGLDTYVGRPGVFRTLGETAAIPFATFAVSTTVPRAVRARLKAALLRAAARASDDVFPGGLRPPAEWSPAELAYV